MEYSENSVTYEVARMILSLGGGIKGSTRGGVTVHLWGAGEIPCLEFFQESNLLGVSAQMYFWVITRMNKIHVS